MIRIFIISLLVFFSCKKDTNVASTEVLEVYGTLDNGEGYSRGDLLHFDSKHYLNGKHIETIYYEGNGEAKGREIFIYEGENSLPSGAEYRDPDSNLLSRYIFEYNSDGEKVKTLAYDGSTGELLRVETFEYHEGKRIRKDIRDQNELIQRSFIFGFDQYGNETEMMVLGTGGDTIAVETYQITLADENNHWIEKWGFLNDVPSTYQILKK